MVQKKKKLGKRLKRKALAFAAVSAVKYAFSAWEDPVVRQKVRKLRRRVKALAGRGKPAA